MGVCGSQKALKNEGLCRRLQALAVPTPAARHRDEAHFDALRSASATCAGAKWQVKVLPLPGTLLISGARGGGSARA